MSSSFKRLPKSITPLNYDLTFLPDFKNHTFTAKSVISVHVNDEGTSNVFVNGKDFVVTEATFRGRDGDVFSVDKIVLDNEKEIVEMEFMKALPVGNGQLELVYNGVVNDTLKGFFRSKYRSVDGQDKYHYITKFEPAFARYCFPCWDEPAIKATFDLTLIIPKNHIAISNMPIKLDEKDEKDASRKIVKFEKSLKMSTYVLAFVIGEKSEIDFIEEKTEDGILCRVYTPVGKSERGQFALDVVRKAIPFYSNYFGVPYPLPKMDLVAVNEYPCGAMENWGLVIFKEPALLVDSKISSTMNKIRVALTTTHETAHMWFGNYVTMEWWNDLWLNEGFASFMEHVCTHHILPELKIWESFASDVTTSVLELDGFASSHPIQVEVGAPSTVGELFDLISYDKGASVIRMLHEYIGEESFKKGMKLYLTKHQFGNAQTEDLWAALAESSKKPVDTVMPLWTKQMGFPILNLKRVEQVGEEKIVSLSYEKFWTNPKCRFAQNVIAQSPNWIIPVTIRKQSDASGVCYSSVIDAKPGEITELRVKAGKDEWIKLNADLVGFYRVCYSPESLNQFIPSIKDKTMGPIDRLGIISDLFATVVGGFLKSTDILKTLLAYEKEDNYTVCSVINNIIVSFNIILSGTELHQNFIKYAHKLLQNSYNRLGWEPIPGESSHDSKLRTIILARLVGLDNETALKEGQRRFALHASGEKTLHPDVRPAAYRAAMKGPEASSGFQFLIKLYENSDLLEEKYCILRALGAAEDALLIQKVLAFGMSEHVNKQDIAVLMISFSTSLGREHAWEFFKTNVKHFQSVYPSGGWYLRALAKLPENFKTSEKALEVEAFFKENKFTGVDRSVEQALEAIRINEAWLQRDYQNISEFLSLP